MRNYNFAVFILTHGRPDNVITERTLRRCGYTGKIYFIIDNEDKSVDRYIEKFGKENIIIFNKAQISESMDEGNNFNDRRTILYARNACFGIAKDLGIKYFIELDDDYKEFKYRFESRTGKGGGSIKNLDNVFDCFIDFYNNTNIKSIAFSQGGDHIGGFSGTSVKRKCMNSFICSTDNPFSFIGNMNEDVNTYTLLGSRGNLFFTYTSIQLDQRQTQQQSGGITDFYLRFGTYYKSFTTVMLCPSSVKVKMTTTTNTRLHHTIKWKNTVPRIIRAEHKKRLLSDLFEFK